MRALKSFLKPGDRVVIEATVRSVENRNGTPTALVVFPEGSGECTVRQHDVMHFTPMPKPGATHPRVKHDWKPPQPHPDLDDSFVPVVWYLPNGSGFEFNFYSRKHRQWGLDYLLELHGAQRLEETHNGFPDMEWPFETPFIPTSHDWEALGIYTLDYVKTPEASTA